jgi:WD40 repeat protein
MALFIPKDMDKQITFAPHGHLLTNANVWSPDGRWIVYDVRSDAAGSCFDGSRIERVNVDTGQVQVLYESILGANCGVATYSPTADQIAFIHGPENPSPDWSYAANHRRGVIVETANPRVAMNVDARDLTPPFTPGALRGGSHVHVFSGDGQWISFTYEDAVLARFDRETPEQEMNLRGVGVSVPARPVWVARDHARNHDGMYFSVLVTKLNANPKPGSDEIRTAIEDAWVGNDGYLRPDGTRQKRAIAFQGQVMTEAGKLISEVFIVDLPEDVTVPGEGPLEGTAMLRPRPPAGTAQRRLTRTDDRKFPGIQGPRHWLRSSPDGSRIAFLMKDDAGIVQVWTISPVGGPITQLTRNSWDIASAFTWSPDGRWLAFAMDNSVFVADTSTGQSHRLTPRSSDAPRPEACVFSPDGKRIAYVRHVVKNREAFNQIFVVEMDTANK